MEIVKLEIIIANSFLPDLVQRLEKFGVEGYTAIDISRGKGLEQGEHLSEGLLPVTRNTLLFSIIHKNIADVEPNTFGEVLHRSILDG